MYQTVASPIGDSFWKTLRVVATLVAVFLTACLHLGIAGQAWGRESATELAGIPLANLPIEAQETLRLIRSGGPFPHARDGAVFLNREGRLPKLPRGSYREYTVKTPGSRDRGARRIVHSARGDFYYTADHYRSFRRIVE